MPEPTPSQQHDLAAELELFRIDTSKIKPEILKRLNFKPVEQPKQPDSRP